MGSIHLFSKGKAPHNFHNDVSLHDETTSEPWKWYSNLPNDAIAVIKNIPVFKKQGKEQYLKYVAGSLDLDDALNKFISKKMVSMLWGSLMHPPTSYRGNEFRYRTADGSNNSVLYPHLGKAGLPYAKSVPTKRPMHGARPDPGDLFDLLMAREGKGEESTSGISMMLLYHATTIIHDIFRTDDKDSNLSATSSYLDLAPLYGNDLKTQHEIRQMTDGLLKIDTFAETRLLNQPPGVCIYLIMYNRFHNYVAKQLKEINEHGRFSLPPGVKDTPEDRANPDNKEAFKNQDEHLFQTARLITCGLYINIAIHDYLKCLMGVHTMDTPWTLDPTKPLPEADNVKGLSRGEGNMVSAEFNLLYRFHSPISRRDAKWSEDLFVAAMKKGGLLNETDVEKEGVFTPAQVKNGEIPLPVFKQYIDGLKNQPIKPPRSETKFWPPGLDYVGATREQLYRFNRNADGYFDSEQLAAEMCRAIEDPICSFGAQQVPKVFKCIEMMGILQGRKWEIATLNEYREFFGMSRFKSFEEINSDKGIQERLRNLYEDPDLVEFYPGAFLEGKGRNIDPGTEMPGGEKSSLWRGVFSDAVTLVRSDRFYTLDWNVGSLTAWGMNEVSSNPKVNKGSVMHRLFQRAFPGCFEYNSLHMWQPFYTPKANIALAKAQGYLNFLDLTNLEDETGKPHKFTKTKYNTYYGDDKVSDKTFAGKVVRRHLEDRGLKDTPPELKWRGDEYFTAKPQPVEITSYKTIRQEILGGPGSKNWVSQVILEPEDVPAGPLRDIMTKQFTELPDAIRVVNECLPKDWEQVFMDYFVGLAQDIRIREQRGLQTRVVNGVKSQCYQLDIVKDLAIPVVTRFFADFIGFWDQVKTGDHTSRKYDENQIYKHIENCQNFEAYNSDPTKTWQRRKDFEASIKVLKQLAEEGVHRNQRGWFEGILWSRSNGPAADGKHVHHLRKIGVDLTQALLRQFGNSHKVAAIMLYTVLDAAQRFVLNFAEVVAWFIDPVILRDRCKHDSDQNEKWSKFKKLAWGDVKKTPSEDGGLITPVNSKTDMKTTRELERYILEVARLSNPLDVVRVYQPSNNQKSGNPTINIAVSSSETKTVKAGETVLLNLRKAYLDPASGLDCPKDFHLRSLEDYISYGPTVSTESIDKTVAPAFSKRASLIALTGLVKHCAHLSELRVAHDKAGRLKRVKTPDGFDRYATEKWDRLVAFPTTWNVRFNGVGTEVYKGKDNADQGHGDNQLIDFNYQSLGGETDKRKDEAEAKKIEDEKAIQNRIDAAVEKAVAQALAKAKINTTPTPDLRKKQTQVTATEVSANYE